MLFSWNNAFDGRFCCEPRGDGVNFELVTVYLFTVRFENL